MKNRKYQFNAESELYDIGCIETIINGYIKGECTNEELYLASKTCEGKIQYFSKFKKNVGKIYTHLFIYIEGLKSNDIDKVTASYNHYVKSFNTVFGHIVKEVKR